MASQYRIRLCREGFYFLIVLLAVLIGAVGRQLNLLMLVGSMMAGPFLFGLVYGYLALRRLSVERKLPTHLRADERLVVDVSVTNRNRWLRIWGIAVEDLVERESTLQFDAESTSVGVFFPIASPRETKHGTYEGRLSLRGRYRFGPLRVSTRFPMGFVRHTIIQAGTEELLVHPKLGQLTPEWAQVARRNETGGQRLQRRGVLEADFYGLRDWRTGDSRRLIHWRTSARRGSPVVRQFEQHRSPDLALLVDLWQPADPTDADLENVEKAVSFLATMIAEACRGPGCHLTVNLAAQEPIFRAGPSSPFFFREQMDVLALVEPHHEQLLPPLLGHSLALLPSAISTIVVSTRPIDWEALHEAAAERDAHLAGRRLLGVHVAGDELARYFQP